MKEGKCDLCGEHLPLVEGHTWPKFAYKRFVSDVQHGGSFYDLQANRSSNKQTTNPYFCKKCDNEDLGSLERYAAAWIDKITAGADSLDYGEPLLAFAVSLSWRVAKYYMPRAPGQPERNMLKKPSRAWKNYLRGKHSIGPYSQHLFILRDPANIWDKKLGGEVMYEERFILTQLGPTYFVGLLDRSHMSLRDIETWSASEIRPEGGVFQNITSWQVGENVTRAFLRVVQTHQRWVVDRVPNKP